MILQSLLRVINFDVVKCVILASPGFYREQLWQYIQEQAVKQDLKTVHENRSKFLLAYASSGHMFALKGGREHGRLAAAATCELTSVRVGRVWVWHGDSEALQDPTVVARMSNTKALAEVNVLGAFLETLHHDPDRAMYGLRHVTAANELGAIDALLVTDGLVRAAGRTARQRYVDLIDSVRAQGGRVHMFSSAHVSGEQLAQVRPPSPCPRRTGAGGADRVRGRAVRGACGRRADVGHRGDPAVPGAGPGGRGR